MPNKNDFISKEMKEKSPQRYEFLNFIMKKKKSPDEILNHGYSLGYSKGFQDGLSQGYADRIREEKENRFPSFENDEDMHVYALSKLEEFQEKFAKLKDELTRG